MPKQRKYETNTDETNIIPLPVYRPNTVKPTTCTPDVTQRVCMLVAQGITIPVAAAALGIKDGTWKAWSRYGREHAERGMESPYTAWNDALEEAKAQCETGWVSMVISGAATDPKYACWLLERRFQDRWALQKQAPAALPEGEDTAGLSTAQLMEQLAAARAAPALSADSNAPAVLHIENTADQEKT